MSSSQGTPSTPKTARRTPQTPGSSRARPRTPGSPDPAAHKSMTDLNNRLTKWVSRVQSDEERVAELEEELDYVRSTIDDKVNEARTALQIELDTTKALLSSVQADRDAVRQTNATLSLDTQNAIARANSMGAENSELKKLLEAAGQEQAKVLVELNTLKRNYETLEVRLRNISAERDDARHSLVAALKRATAAEVQLADKQNQQSDLQKRLSETTQRMSEEISHLQAQLSEAKQRSRVSDTTLLGRIQELRKELEEEYRERFEQQQANFDAKELRLTDNLEEERALREELKRRVDDLMNKMNSLHGAHEALGKKKMDQAKEFNQEKAKMIQEMKAKDGELERLRMEMSQAQAQLTTSEQDIDTLQETNKDLEARLSAVETSLLARERSAMQTLKEKDDYVEDLRAELDQKDDEIDELTDSNLALAQEIQTYKRILDAGEDQVRRSRKRRRVDDNEDQVQSLYTTLYIKEVNPRGDYVTISNPTKDSISLAGWTIRNALDGQRYRFPENFFLSGNADVTVWSGSKNKHISDTFSDRLWDSTSVWEDTQSVAYLYDDKDLLVHKVVPEGHVEGTGVSSSSSSWWVSYLPFIGRFTVGK